MNPEIKLQFFVPGTPVPKGSAKAFYVKKLNRAIVTQDNREKQKPWASMISVMAQNSMAGRMVCKGAVKIDVTFVFARPKSHYRIGKNSHLLRENAPADHIVKPDRDKLLRCVLDALKPIVYEDDCQTNDGNTKKVYGDNPGAHIHVTFNEGGPINNTNQKELPL